ncbi:MAG TPA: hypothetical protein VGW75_04480 [Solirubrobacteraceae bacterium]|nr:hypothetical protein [Solirubrobacteraceae bacterium]
MSPAPTFELLAFEATPVSGAIAVVEVEGRFTGPAPAASRLLVETGGVPRELPALETRDGAAWCATFAIPLAALTDPDASFALAPSRGPLIVLPSPTQSGGDDDRFVRLARTANDLRHRLQSATAAASAAEARLAEAEAQRDALDAELSAAREAAATAERRSEESHAAAVVAREEQARAEGEADEARADAERARLEAEAEVGRVRAEAESSIARALAEARVEARAEIERAEAEAAAAREQLAEAQDRAIAAEDDARAARRDLRDARARVESLLRQARTTRSAAARARVPSATPDHDDAEFRAARLGPGWADGADDDEPRGGDDQGVPLAGPIDDDDRAARLADRALGGDEEELGGGAGGRRFGPVGREVPGEDRSVAEGAGGMGSEGEDERSAGVAGEGDDGPLVDRAGDDHTTEYFDPAAPLADRSAGDDYGNAAPLADQSAGDDDNDAAPLADRAGDDHTTEYFEPPAPLADRSAGDDDAPLVDRPGDDDTTAPFEPAAGEAPTTARLGSGSPRAPELWGDEEGSEGVRILRPRTSAGRLRPARVAPSSALDDDVLDPAAVGARLIRPAETSPRHRATAVLTNPRVIVGTIFVLLFIALVLIFAGVGPV